MYQRLPAFDPSGAKGVKKCSRHFFQDQARYKRNDGFDGIKEAITTYLPERHSTDNNVIIDLDLRI
ncbi:MAG: hypothetical protein DWP95_03695 [Proteobacteria bacterium]|nr:MAG: hypothetical protein DWP95_03695 [Pseudomonadota bacterium]